MQTVSWKTLFLLLMMPPLSNSQAREKGEWMLLDTKVYRKEREVKREEGVRPIFLFFCLDFNKINCNFWREIFAWFWSSFLGFMKRFSRWWMMKAYFLLRQKEHLRRVVLLYSLLLVLLFLQRVFISSQLSFVVLVRRRRGVALMTL